MIPLAISLLMILQKTEDIMAELKNKKPMRKKRILIMKGSGRHREFFRAKKDTMQKSNVNRDKKNDVIELREICKLPSKLELFLYTLGVGGLVIFCGLFALVLYGISK